MAKKQHQKIFDSDTENAKDVIDENTNDLISKLPDEVLCYIISFLPFESAVQTSFLSTRWRGLWNTALRLVVQYGSVEDIGSATVAFADHIDEPHLSIWRLLYHSNLKMFRNSRRLQFHFGQGSILLATIVANEILHLDFSKGMDEFPGEFGWHFETDNHSHWPGFSSLSKHSFPPYIFVKTLHLISVTCLTSEAVSSMVSKCLFLESLTIKECPGLQTLLIHTGHNFHHLTVFNCLQLMSLHIKAPGLQKFRYGGLLPRFKYESSSCLKDAMLDFRGGPSYDPLKYTDLKASEILPDITNVRILTLCRWTFEHIQIKFLNHFLPEVSRLCPSRAHWPFQLSELRELWWIDSSMDKHNIDALLTFLKLCPSLEKLFINIDPRSYFIPSISHKHSSHEVAEYKRLDHLKVIKMEGVMNEEEEIISLAEHLLEVATTELLIIAKSHENRLCRLVKVQLSNRNCKNVPPPFQEKKYCYKFVEVEEGYSDELCFKHPHMDL
ncbi:hypothetical protein AAG906_010981 [Vitis piasezkii]